MRTNRLIFVLLLIAGYSALTYVITVDDYFDGPTICNSRLFMIGVLLPIVVVIMLTIDLAIAYLREKIGRPEREQHPPTTPLGRMLRGSTWIIIALSTAICMVAIVYGAAAGILYGTLIGMLGIVPVILAMLGALIYRGGNLAIQKARDQQLQKPLVKL